MYLKNYVQLTTKFDFIYNITFVKWYGYFIIPLKPNTKRMSNKVRKEEENNDKSVDSGTKQHFQYFITGVPTSAKFFPVPY